MNVKPNQNSGIPVQQPQTNVVDGTSNTMMTKESKGETEARFSKDTFESQIPRNEPKSITLCHEGFEFKSERSQKKDD